MDPLQIPYLSELEAHTKCDAVSSKSRHASQSELSTLHYTKVVPSQFGRHFGPLRNVFDYLHVTNWFHPSWCSLLELLFIRIFLALAAKPIRGSVSMRSEYDDPDKASSSALSVPEISIWLGTKLVWVPQLIKRFLALEI
ncbi:hypothetical protein JTB14_020167 [Gonioctena quinquepunctata]|nr:hypothetical protein JTB14_020167 [Gonioctena quinquepunctata]